MAETLYQKLQRASSEADVIDAYINALGIKEWSKGLVDLTTKEAWFEAKIGSVPTVKMFTQLFYYVNEAMKGGTAQPDLFNTQVVPPILCVFDSEKAALMNSEAAQKILAKIGGKIQWGSSASDVTEEAQCEVACRINNKFTEYYIAANEKDFVEAFRDAVARGRVARRAITACEINSVFNEWVEAIGRQLCARDGEGVSDKEMCQVFYADLMSNGKKEACSGLLAQLFLKNASVPCFLLGGKMYEVSDKASYAQFWSKYDRPPRKNDRAELLSRRDKLIPVDERIFHGDYYTPSKVCLAAYKLLKQVLGDNWHKEYIVWDTCCGAGNLEVNHGKAENVFMSTLEERDVNIMQVGGICKSATRFQYDYLNDDITEDGKIDYNMTGKVPEELRRAIADAKAGTKKMLILMNPPYAEATNADNIAKEAGMAANKAKVAKDTKVAACIMGRDWGKATNELFTQFLARIAVEVPNAIVAMFSTLKYVNAPNFEQFREKWNAEYKGGFIVHSKAFENLKGDFPIGFLIWQTNNKAGAERTPIKEVKCTAYEVKLDKNKRLVEVFPDPHGDKTFYNIPASKYLNVWMDRPKVNDADALPLTNAVTTAKGKVWLSKWSDGAIGYAYCCNNDLQHSGQQTALMSSVYSGAHGIYITPDNVDQFSVVFTVRQLIAHKWTNHNDQFLQPSAQLPQEFIDDCLVWMLFHGKNLTAGADGLEWQGKKWSITNHFVPYRVERDCAAPEKLPSDFMVRHLEGKTLSKEAKTVLDAGKRLWKAYFKGQNNNKTRAELKLGRMDAGWYQIRHALDARQREGVRMSDAYYGTFNNAYGALTQKLQPLVYEYGFLKK